MDVIPYPEPVDHSPYETDGPDLERKYGLPGEVAFCKRCVISNQRPNSAVEFKHTKDSTKATINFDEDGICDACRVTEQKVDIDWDERTRELRELCDRHRKTDGSYDCICLLYTSPSPRDLSTSRMPSSA